jgi:hypothetical protein
VAVHRFWSEPAETEAGLEVYVSTLCEAEEASQQVRVDRCKKAWDTVANDQTKLALHTAQCKLD